jgi:peptide/nickel transport system permease protein
MRNPAAILAAGLIAIFVLGALLAPWMAPQDPFDPRQLSLTHALIPPQWIAGGDGRFLLGTDPQGRDLLSAILYGSRISLLVGLASLAIAVTIGMLVGLPSGYFGGMLDTVLMRLVDIQLTIPPILTALVFGGIARAALPRGTFDANAPWLLVLDIGIASWPQYARLVRSGTLTLKGRDYVAAARLSGTSSAVIAVRHILPNIAGPLLVVATLGFAIAVSTEATLSFLGVGVSATTPSLGTLIRIGANFLFSGQWWIALFPSMVLMLVSLSVNILGDWLRNRLEPGAR